MQALDGIFPALLACPLVKILRGLVSSEKPDGLRSLTPKHLFVMQKVINLSSNLIYFVQIFPKLAALSSSSSPYLAFNRSQVFPKVYLLQATRSILHLLIFSNKQNIGLPIGWHCVQEVLILSSHYGWATHFSSKQWSFVFRWWRKLMGSVVNKMGSWSE